MQAANNEIARMGSASTLVEIPEDLVFQTGRLEDEHGTPIHEMVSQQFKFLLLPASFCVNATR